MGRFQVDAEKYKQVFHPSLYLLQGSFQVEGCSSKATNAVRKDT